MATMESPAGGVDRRRLPVHAIVSVDGSQVREHREHAGAAELALIDGNGAVEIHDWLPLARPAGCFIASRLSRCGDHDRFFGATRTPALRERRPAARSGAARDLILSFGGIARTENDHRERDPSRRRAERAPGWRGKQDACASKTLPRDGHALASRTIEQQKTPPEPGAGLFEERLKGLEPSTFCMASDTAPGSVEHRIPANRRKRQNGRCGPVTRFRPISAEFGGV